MKRHLAHTSGPLALMAAGLILVLSQLAAASPSATLEAAGGPDEALVKKYPFRGSTIEWDQSLNVVSLSRSAELTWNPSYTWVFRAYPRYHFTEELYLRLKVGLGIEWTDADDTTTRREPRWEDLWLDAVYAPVYTERYSGISLTPSLRLILPTSIEARAKSLTLGLGPGFSLRRTFDLPWHMTVDLGYGLRYIKNFNRHSTVGTQEPTIQGCGSSGGEGGCGEFLHTGSRVASHEFLNSLSARLGITRKLTTAVSVIFRNQLLYGLTPAEVEIGGAMIPVPEDPTASTGQRAYIWYLFEAGYEVHPTVTLSLYFSTLNPQLADDSTYHTPFFNRYTELGLNVSVALDQIVARVERAIRGRRASPSAPTVRAPGPRTAAAGLPGGASGAGTSER